MKKTKTIKLETYQKKIQRLKDSADRKEKRLKKRIELQKSKAKQSSKSYLKKTLWKLVSKWVRTHEDHCYTCRKFLPWKKRTAGHFWTQGGHQRTRFELMNVHTQCVSCNSFNSGNLAPYAIRLVEDYGVAAFQSLHRRANDSTPWEKQELEEAIQEYKSKLSNL